MSSAPIAATMKMHSTFRVEKYLIPRTNEEKNHANGKERNISSIPTAAKNQEPIIKRRYKKTATKLITAFNASDMRMSKMISKIRVPMK